MAYQFSSIQRQLLLQALDCIREDLRPSLSPRQTLFANRAAQCISQALDGDAAGQAEAAAPVLADADDPKHGDPLELALGRLDDCLTRRLREGRLTLESRRHLQVELRTAAQILARPQTAASTGQTACS